MVNKGESEEEKKLRMIEAVKQILIRLLQEAVPAGALTEPEINALSGMCVMAIAATGTEDPRALASQVSNPVLDHIVSRLPELQSHKLMGPVSQLLLIEWCYRNDYLNDDWMWEWTGPTTGQAHISPKIPLDQVPLPQIAAGKNTKET